MKSSIAIFGVLIIVLIAGCASQTERPELVAKEANVATLASSDASVGWSTKDDYTAGITEAINTAKARLNGKQPSFAYVVYISASETDHDIIIGEIRRQLPGVKIYGHTSNMIITNDAVIEDNKFAIGVMLVASDSATFGIGSVNQDDYKENPEDAGRVAIEMAMADAGRTTPPEMILYMGTTMRGQESHILSGIAGVVGDVPVVGGNAKDFGSKMKNNWMQFTHNETYNTGLVLVAIYTNRKVGWGFEATFRLTDKHGIVTKSDGFRIAEIDGRPALDVYDEWVGGEFYRRLNAGEFNSAEEKVDFALVKAFTLLNPIAKIIRGADGQVAQFATSPIPDQQDVNNKTLTVYAQVSTGDEISLYSGTWQTAMNRVETIPRSALLRSGLAKGEGSFAFLIICNGLKTVIPTDELQKMSAITNDVLGAPFLGAVTAGEQGPIPGIGNVNANLVESVVLVG
jgi:hypothetical protein